MSGSLSKLITVRSKALFDMVGTSPQQDHESTRRRASHNQSNRQFLDLSRYDQRIISDAPQYHSARHLPVLSLRTEM